MSETKTFEVTCIICPVGCRAKVTVTGSAVKVDGVDCPRGQEYVLKEITKPERDFFSTIQVKGGRIRVCPVRSNQPVPKDKIIDCAREVAGVIVEAPIKVGDTILDNINGLGVSIVATRDVERSDEISP
jgi:CxxC motif-containing protein